MSFLIYYCIKYMVKYYADPNIKYDHWFEKKNNLFLKNEKYIYIQFIIYIHNFIYTVYT